MTVMIDGKALADEIVQHVAQEVSAFKLKHKVTPGLAVVLVGDDPASAVYVRNKIKRTEQAGLQSIAHYLPAETTQQQLDELIDQLNRDDSVHGILVQLPLPAHLSESRVIEAISPEKDVDGFHPENVGKLVTGQQVLVPCTPLGCMIMLKRHIDDLSGKHAVVIGRSNIVGKPIANLLLQSHCTVTIVHSRTQHIEEICRAADIVVAAVGQPLMVKEDWLKPNAVVIDVGINQISLNGKRKLVGDVDYHDVFSKVSAITPVPGGVGPMTIACLMQNTLTAAQHQLN
ncbi:bifunctional methylenetetrahydrofolate dehydrogenase/methenyltetrahydrofolate cyclohydrolase FolD [Marinomonas spartinae]|uniref:bifunctional methylenetetrahydrofolate dehydrogenase/methenyltetrahydrofolate cyclohydrolase FolD n=1 Tax=Marinomonas spartinae TaxID=1792290 RepID=UPI0018F16161|nr:bifunctional methylenetetrahydrofolate dehydrogenase/methenyltetrahydrofolate cyclohydrolase FolD [Marinomonas spartinae]MBJ7555341.1 bifunctional methylenetetrahydrofolate dehydrogenase/methenyltetrahydrofolate cyclohydrolase FolD [Marinomonas spartinae]